MCRSRAFVMWGISLFFGTCSFAHAGDTAHRPGDQVIEFEQDGRKFDMLASIATEPGGDCNDTNAAVYPLQVEVVGNRKDDDCDGLADEDVNNNPSTDSNDFDADAYSLATNDCDDTNAGVRPGQPEVFGNFIDDNCNGMADEDALGNPSPDIADHDGDGVTIGSDRIFGSGFDVLPAVQ